MKLEKKCPQRNVGTPEHRQFAETTSEHSIRLSVFKLLQSFLLSLMIIFAASASWSQTPVDADPNEGVTGQQIPLIVPVLNNSTNDVIISGFPVDAELSAGIRDLADPATWIVPVADVRAGVTFVTNTAGIFDLTFNQPTVGNQFLAFDNGTFGTGTEEFRSFGLGSASTFTFVDGSGSNFVRPGEYAVVQSTDGPERANDENEALCDGIYISLEDRVEPGSGYFLIFDAQSASTAPNQTFVSAPIQGLLPDTEYVVSFDAGNVYTGFSRTCRVNPDNVFPEFSLRISDDASTPPTAADEVANTGVIPGQTPWTTFNSTFTTAPGQTDAVLNIEMTGTGGLIGADVIFDNFVFSANSADTERYTVFAPPVAVDDESINNTAGDDVTLNLSSNDTDGDDNLDPSTISLIPPDGTPAEDITTVDGDIVEIVVDGEGTWSLNEAGLLTFTPLVGYAGDPTPISYTVQDDDGLESAAAEVTVTYLLEPFVCDATFYEVILDQLFALNVNTGNYDPIGDPVGFRYNSTAYNVEDNFIYGLEIGGTTEDISLLRIGAGGFYEPVLTVGVGSNDGTADDNGNYYFNARANSVSVIDISTLIRSTVTFGGSVGTSGVADIAFVEVDGQDLLVGASLSRLLIWNLSTGQASSVQLDGLPGGTAFGAAWSTSDGRVYLSANNSGTIYIVEDILTDPRVIFDFDAQQSNQHDGMNCYTASPPFTVPPVAVADEDLGNTVGDDVTLNITSNDNDGSRSIDPSTVSLIVPDGVTLDGSETIVDGDVIGFTVDGEGTWSVDEAGNLTFEPEDGFDGDPTPILYTVTSPSSGLDSDPATVTVGYDVPPVAEDDESLNNAVGDDVTLNLTSNDTDGDGNLDPSTVSLIVPAGVTLVGSETLDADGNIIGFEVEGEGTWTVDDDTGVLVFSPAEGFVGDPTEITYTVADEDGQRSDPATVTVGYVDPPQGEIELVKSISGVEDTNGNGIFGDAGDTVMYEYTVANTGDTSLSDVEISDPGFDTATSGNSYTPNDAFDGLLSVGEGTGSNPPVIIGTGAYIITADDVLEGEISTSATVESTAVAADENGEPNPDAPLFDNNGPYDVVDDLSDTGTEPELDREVGAVAEIEDPANTASAGDLDNAGNDPTVLFLQDPGQGDFTLTKATPSERVLIGETVSYEIVATSLLDADFAPIQIIDTLPVGMAYTPGSATIEGVAVEPVVAGPTLTFSDLLIPANGSLTITLQARVTSAATAGVLTNVVDLVDQLNGEILAEQASASVLRTVETVFDCSPVIGKVFDDVNMDGYQDQAPDVSAMITNQDIFVDKMGGGKLSDAFPEQTEVGIPNVRLVTPSGTIITTDANGLYSVPCAEIPSGIGSNFMLKLDTRTLPTGYRVTTENPRVMRLTSGLMTEMNFGAAIGRVFDVDLSGRAYEAGEVAPSQVLATGLEGVLLQIADTPTVVRISYYRDQEDADLARDRLDAIEDMIEEKWTDIGTYRLLIEKSVNQLQ